MAVDLDAPRTAPVEVARIVRPGDLTGDDRALWRSLTATHPELERPFFSPGWFDLLEESGHAVEIAVLADDRGDRAFFPFIRDGRIARPPGGSLCDFQGWVGPPDLAVDMGAMVRAIGATAWRFNHLLARQAAAARFSWEDSESPFADLSGGFAAFEAVHRGRGASWIPRLRRMVRRIERELGPLHFEFATSDASMLQRLVDWKRAQRRRTRTRDPLIDGWAARTLNGCLERHEPDFAGVLSALHAGDRLVAAHLGIRSRHTLHLWFTAYDVGYEQHSPGVLLLHRMLQGAPEAGIARIDFGKGRERYKLSFMTGSERLAEGFVASGPVPRALNAAWFGSRRWLRSSGIAERLSGPRRRVASLARGLRHRGPEEPD